MDCVSNGADWKAILIENIGGAVMGRKPEKKERRSIDPVLYSATSAAAALDIGLTSLWSLQQRHPLYKPFKFAIRPSKKTTEGNKDSKRTSSTFYTALQIEAIKQVFIGNKNEEDAYKEFMQGEKNLATMLTKQLLVV
jgi:hypothetical protein